MRSVRRKQVDQNKKVQNLAILTICILLFIYITLSLIFGEKGLFRYIKLHSDREQITAENSRIEKQNREITQQVEMIENEPDTFEEIAREQGFTKEGELIFKFNEEK